MSSAKLGPQTYATDNAADVVVRQNFAIAAERNGRIAHAETMTSLIFRYELPEVLASVRLAESPEVSLLILVLVSSS